MASQSEQLVELCSDFVRYCLTTLPGLQARECRLQRVSAEGSRFRICSHNITSQEANPRIVITTIGFHPEESNPMLRLSRATLATKIRDRRIIHEYALNRKLFVQLPM